MSLLSVLLEHWQALVLVLTVAVGGVWHWLQTKHARAEGLAEGKALQAQETLGRRIEEQAKEAEASRAQAEAEAAAAAERAKQATTRIESAEEMVESLKAISRRGPE